MIDLPRSISINYNYNLDLGKRGESDIYFLA